MTKDGPAWLRRYIGDDRMQVFDTVYQVGIKPFSDADFARFNMSAHKQIRVLILNGTEITDAGLDEIGKMTTLAHLYLENTQVTDKGVEKLKSLKGLETIWLSGTKVSAGGKADLQKALPNLLINL